MKFLQKVSNAYKKLEIGFISVLFAVAFVIIVLQIFSRFVMGRQFIWTDELSTVLQMVISFLGIGYGIRTKKHIRVDGLYQKFPEPAKRLVNILTNLVFIAVCFVMIDIAMELVRQNWNANFGTFAVSKGKVFLTVPVSYGLAAIYCAIDAVNEVLELFRRKKAFHAESEVK